MAVKNIQIGDFFATNNPISDSALLDASTSFANIVKHSGFTSPERRIPGYDKPNRDGWQRVNQLYGQRTLGFELQLYGRTQAEFESMRSNLVDAGNLGLGTRTMTIMSHDDRIYEVDGIISRLIDSGKLVYNEERYTMLFVCDTITFSDLGYDGMGEQATIVLADSLVGLEYSSEDMGAEYEAEYGVGNLEARTITNSGTAPVYPTIRLNGPLSSPVIKNETTNQSFKINIAIESGDWVDINMDTQEVLNSAGESVFGFVDPAIRNFWQLAVGDNVIFFGHSGAINDEASAIISWKNAVLFI